MFGVVYSYPYKHLIKNLAVKRKGENMDYHLNDHTTRCLLLQSVVPSLLHERLRPT